MVAVTPEDSERSLRFFMAVRALEAAGVDRTAERIYAEDTGGHGRWCDMSDHGRLRYQRLALAALGFKIPASFQD